MQLTRYTDYGLRTLIYLALLPDSERANIDQISSAYGISRNNVNKIVHQLGKAGVIETRRGKGGGFRLAKPAQEINIGDMVQTLESTLQVVECRSPVCQILPACKLKGILQRAMQAFIDELHQYTLQDLLTDRKRQLVDILNLPV